jgi:hypothetical protein
VDVALEPAEVNTTAHGSETIGWLAIEAGQGTWSGHAYEAAETADAVYDSWYHLPFGRAFGQAPRFVGTLATYDGADNCDPSASLRTGLCYGRTSLKAYEVQVKIEEDTTYDGETTHTSDPAPLRFGDAAQGSGIPGAGGGRRPEGGDVWRVQREGKDLLLCRWAAGGDAGRWRAAFSPERPFGEHDDHDMARRGEEGGVALPGVRGDAVHVGRHADQLPLYRPT